jgi:DNA-binding response OmpR family regulator
MQPALLLLVEDEETVRSVLEDSLRDGGFDLKLALNGTEALAILEREGETIHGLITDINLGSRPSGWEVAKRARELIPELPVVYMSGTDAEKWASLGVPNSTIVAKPFAPAQIVTAISTLLNVSDKHS